MQSAWTRLGPAHWSALTHKHVSVHAHNGHELRGLVLTVDPVSASLVLVDLKGPGEVRMVLGHAVKQVQVLDQDPDLDQDQRTRLETLFRDSEEFYSRFMMVSTYSDDLTVIHGCSL